MNLHTFTGKGCQVAIVEHSLNTHTGKELVTYQLRYWRAIHAEFMTHRAFSRNAGSSRAIPVHRILEQVSSAPAGPVHWGRNQPGMQAHEEQNEVILDPNTGEQLTREEAWLRASTAASKWASAFSDAGYHKQLVNRLVEPFTYISVVVTATEWDNWFELRDHEDAQPEIRDLARTMRQAHSASKARHITQRSIKDPRDWHLPYVTLEERKTAAIEDLLAMSAARCARVSYLTHDKANPKLEDDVALYKRLVESKPLHASPLEHQAVVSNVDHRSQNLLGGWIQHRFMLEVAGSIDNLKRTLTDMED